MSAQDRMDLDFHDSTPLRSGGRRFRKSNKDYRSGMTEMMHQTCKFSQPRTTSDCVTDDRDAISPEIKKKSNKDTYLAQFRRRGEVFL